VLSVLALGNGFVRRLAKSRSSAGRRRFLGWVSKTDGMDVFSHLFLSKQLNELPGN
jgi:hypothetical protein